MILRNCRLANNTEYFDSTVVGIGGVMVREGSEVHVEQCAIINNSWDGVALYRGATATITDCVIDSGRGAGIGVTWDAAAICLRNRISRYWKGIGTFGTATDRGAQQRGVQQRRVGNYCCRNKHADR